MTRRAPPLAACALMLALAPACKSSSSQSSLAPIDVSADRIYSHVNLVLVANGTISKTFPDVTFGETAVLHVGIYLPSSLTGSVGIVAEVQDGTCTLARGSTAIPDVVAGKTSGPVAVSVVHLATCEPISTPDGGPDGSGGGVVGPGTGGATTGAGGSRGTGGSGTGTGGGSSGTGGSGPTGSGGGGPGSGGAAVGSGGAAVGSGGAAVGSGGSTAGTGGAGACGNLIDNMEANTGNICTGNGRVGHWFTYVDSLTASSITPRPSDTTAAPPYAITPARGTSNYAMRASGSYGSYAGIACLLNNAVIGQAPKTFDASGYAGIRFFAKGTGISVVAQTSATIATQYGGTCTATTCYGASAPVQGLVADTWTEHTVSFALLVANPGNAPFRVADLWSIGFQPQLLGSFDFWIDDVSFY